MPSIAMDMSGSSEVGKTFQVMTLNSINDIPEEEWNSCANDAAGVGQDNPFILWAFLKALEESKSAASEVGWAPKHVVVRQEN
jgi:hypothetical protein